MYPHMSCLNDTLTLERPWWSSLVADLRDDDIPSLDDPDIRTELILRIRREIAEGTYETPEKWQTALDRLISDLEG